MSEKVLHLAPGLAIPAEEFIESATALIGKRGAGKSGGVKVLEEELFRVGLPFITLDPTGIHWGIKSSFDGKSPGLPVLVIGGKHGDLRLDRRAGAETARAVIEANISCVVDFSEEPKAAYREFVRDFAQELYSKNESPRVVIIEEAPELVPQRVQADRAATYEAVERLVSRGRNKGIGVVLVSQRMATTNKDVVTQVDNLFVGRLLGKPDRKALTDWVEAWDAEERLPEFERNLPTLPTRTMWLWSPEKLKFFGPVRFKDFKTLHADKTHLRRMGLLETRPVTTDVSSVVAKLGKQMERLAKDKTETARIPHLEAQVRRLESELAKRPPPGHQSGAPSRADVDKAVSQAEAPLKAEIRQLQRSLAAADSTRARIRRDIVAIEKILGESNGHTAVVEEVTRPTIQSTPPLPPRRPSTHILARDTRLDESGEPRPEALPTGGALRMIRALAGWHPETLSRVDLGVVAEIAPGSGTFSDYLSLLRRNGFIEERTDGSVGATKEGIEFASGGARLLPEEIQRSALSRVSGGARRMLEKLIQSHPEPFTRQTLGEVAEVTPNSGTFSDYLSMLRRLGFIETQGQFVSAREVLFA